MEDCRVKERDHITAQPHHKRVLVLQRHLPDSLGHWYGDRLLCRTDCPQAGKPNPNASRTTHRRTLTARYNQKLTHPWVIFLKY
jgi:hypothetical protein